MVFDSLQEKLKGTETDKEFEEEIEEIKEGTKERDTKREERIKKLEEEIEDMKAILQEGREDNFKDVLDNSIPKAKEKIKEMKQPDFEKLFKIEKGGKDRKGMKKFLQKKM